MTAPGAGLSSFPAGGLAVVIGSSGGVGQAVLRALERSGRFAAVLGLGRSSDPALDLLDEPSIDAAAARAGGTGLELRLVFDATGVLQDDRAAPEKALRAITPEGLAHAFAVNAIGPALLMKHWLPRLPRSGKAVFATLSARVGSIGDNRLGGWYGYRASKAALNQLVRTAAVELARTHPSAVCVALHPGTVDTRLSAPHARTGLRIRSPDQSASDLLAVLDGLGPEATGAFRDADGRQVDW